MKQFLIFIIGFLSATAFWWLAGMLASTRDGEIQAMLDRNKDLKTDE